MGRARSMDVPPPAVLAQWVRADGWAYERIGAALGVAGRTVRRWVADPEVAALLALVDVDVQPVPKARVRAKELLPTVMEVVEELLLDVKQAGAIRLKASEIVLKLADAFAVPHHAREPVTIPSSPLEEAEQVYRDVVQALRDADSNPAAVAALVSRREDAYRAVQVERARGKVSAALTEEQVASLAQASPDRLVWLWVEEWSRRYPDWIEAQRDALPKADG